LDDSVFVFFEGPRAYIWASGDGSWWL